MNDTELLDEFQKAKDGTSITDDISGTPEDKDTIGFCDATFVWSNDVEGFSTPSRRLFRLILEDEVVFRKGINLVIGPTGSGKTSLLMALLGKYKTTIKLHVTDKKENTTGEMHYLPSGPSSWVSLPREKGVAYAAQESWVLNETIRVSFQCRDPCSRLKDRWVFRTIYCLVQLTTKSAIKKVAKNIYFDMKNLTVGSFSYSPMWLGTRPHPI